MQRSGRLKCYYKLTKFRDFNRSSVKRTVKSGWWEEKKTKTPQRKRRRRRDGKHNSNKQQRQTRTRDKQPLRLCVCVVPQCSFEKHDLLFLLSCCCIKSKKETKQSCRQWPKFKRKRRKNTSPKRKSSLAKSHGSAAARNATKKMLRKPWCKPPMLTRWEEWTKRQDRFITGLVIFTIANWKIPTKLPRLTRKQVSDRGFCRIVVVVVVVIVNNFHRDSDLSHFHSFSAAFLF